MGGIISLLIGILAAIAFYGTGHPILFWVAVAICIVCIWSWGVMHNYALKAAKGRWDQIRENMIREGRPPEEIERMDRTPIRIATSDVDAVPDWLATVNMIVTFIGLGLLIWGIIVRFF